MVNMYYRVVYGIYIPECLDSSVQALFGQEVEEQEDQLVDGEELWLLLPIYLKNGFQGKFQLKI